MHRAETTIRAFILVSPFPRKSQVKTASHLREVHIQKTNEFDALQKDADRLAGDYQRQVAVHISPEKYVAFAASRASRVLIYSVLF